MKSSKMILRRSSRKDKTKKLDNSSLAKNSIYNVIYKGLNILFPLITMSYVARIILAVGVGKVGYAQNIAQYFVTLAALGIPNYGIREISKLRGELNARDKVFSELFVINFISTLFFTCLYYSFIMIIPGFRERIPLLLVVGSSICFNALNVDWFYQGMEEYRFIAFRSLAMKAVSLILVFIFVRSSNDAIIYAAINCLAIGGNNIWNMIRLQKKQVHFILKGLNLKQHMGPILVLLASVIAIELYTLLDTTMIGIFCTDEAVGYYTNSMKLIRLLITFVTAIGGVLLPRLSVYHDRGMEKECSETVSKVFAVMLSIFVPCQIGIFFLSNQIMATFFGESFTAAGITLRIASFLICTLGFSNLFGTQVLLTYGKEKWLLLTTIAGAVINITLNLILIPRLQQNGATIASVISETAVTVLSIVFARRFIKIYMEKRVVLSLIISSLSVLVVAAVTSIYLKTPITALIIAVVSGATVYISINWLMKNPILEFLVSLVKKKKI